MKILIKEYLLQICVGKTFLSTAFRFKKKHCLFFFKDYLEVADTHTQMFSPIPRILRKLRGINNFFKIALFPLLDSL